MYLGKYNWQLDIRRNIYSKRRYQLTITLGVFNLLDLVAPSDYAVKRHALGCLLDLLENPKVLN